MKPSHPLWVSMYLALCTVAVVTWGFSTDFLLVADNQNSTIYIGSLDNFDLTPLPLDNVRFPVAVDYDPVDKMVYWTDLQEPRISRAYLNGSQQKTLIDSNLSLPVGLALDPEGRLMFWIDGYPNNKIERSSMDGLDRRVIIWDNLTHPRAIVADHHRGHIYWTNCETPAKIEKADYDGRHRVVLVDKSIMWPNGLALDVRAGWLYWCDAGSKTFERIDLLGNNRETIADVSKWRSHPFDLTLYGSFLLWTDWNSDSVMRLHMTHEEITNQGPFIFKKAVGIHVYAVQDDVPHTELSYTYLNDSMCSEHAVNFALLVIIQLLVLVLN